MFGINAFQILKLMAHNYRGLGFTELAQTCQEKLDKIKDVFPEVEKDDPDK